MVGGILLHWQYNVNLSFAGDKPHSSHSTPSPSALHLLNETLPINLNEICQYKTIHLYSLLQRFSLYLWRSVFSLIHDGLFIYFESIALKCPGQCHSLNLGRFQLLFENTISTPSVSPYAELVYLSQKLSPLSVLSMFF